VEPAHVRPRANWDIDHNADVRTLFADHGAAPGGMLALLPTTDLFGLKLIRGELGPVAREIVTMARIGEPATIQFINAHCVNTLINDADYRAALAADHLLPDGSGLAIAAKLAGVEMGANLNGTDLFPEICDHAARQGVSIYLLGGKPGIASMAARTMRQRYRGVSIVGTRHGFWTAQEEQAMIDEINASGARIVMVGMGVPRQESGSRPTVTGCARPS
jgi:UDP-N-acetyl-D-mannosaminuronic acid transferase (WecB/TagA/CpsF family)